MRYWIGALGFSCAQAFTVIYHGLVNVTSFQIPPALNHSPSHAKTRKNCIEYSKAYEMEGEVRNPSRIQLRISPRNQRICILTGENLIQYFTKTRCTTLAPRNICLLVMRDGIGLIAYWSPTSQLFRITCRKCHVVLPWRHWSRPI